MAALHSCTKKPKFAGFLDVQISHLSAGHPDLPGVGEVAALRNEPHPPRKVSSSPISDKTMSGKTINSLPIGARIDNDPWSGR